MKQFRNIELSVTVFNNIEFYLQILHLIDIFLQLQLFVKTKIAY